MALATVNGFNAEKPYKMTTLSVLVVKFSSLVVFRKLRLRLPLYGAAKLRVKHQLWLCGVVVGHNVTCEEENRNVDTRGLTSTENQWELAVNVHQERRSCDSSEVEQLVSVTSVHPPVHVTSTSQYMKPVTPATTTPATTTAPTATTPPTTTITTAPTTTTPASTTTTKPRSCPHSGYRLFQGFNCYKTYSEWKIWSDAREQCKRDGGDLMVAESERERSEVFPTMYKSVSRNPWMGVYKPEGEDRWVSVKGEPALSSWWRAGYPDNSAGYKCARGYDTGLLWNTDCAVLRPFICEIPL
ncbi:hemolymph lipopolysaccharide-binding protein-like [Anabrus simplex]|uniref:hemolymph lipopolysaccharide-binding protein-like n=1 Tax=Anabrus simplex TaxID=316456 RepID=UPI0035A286BF